MPKKTIAAVDRTFGFRRKLRDDWFPAIGAGRSMKLRVSLGTFWPAGFAALRLGEAHLGEEGLAARGERKTCATLSTLQDLVLEFHFHRSVRVSHSKRFSSSGFKKNCDA
jgi:hypothetical protein